jgi:predicted nucleotidyltransferase component of viral defense system
MKLSALLSRAKGRDFYDVLFLLSQTKPNFDYLTQKKQISNISNLKEKINDLLEQIDLKHKSKDFEHLLFNKMNAEKIIHFKEFIDQK